MCNDVLQVLVLHDRDQLMNCTGLSFEAHLVNSWHSALIDIVVPAAIKL